MNTYISVECPHCGKEAARLRLGEAAEPELSAALEGLAADEQAKLELIDLNISTRLLKLILNLHPKPRTVGELIQHDWMELRCMKGMGSKSINEILSVLGNMNLSFADYYGDTRLAQEFARKKRAPALVTEAAASPCPR